MGRKPIVREQGSIIEGPRARWEVLHALPVQRFSRWWCRCLLCNEEEREITNQAVNGGQIPVCKNLHVKAWERSRERIGGEPIAAIAYEARNKRPRAVRALVIRQYQDTRDGKAVWRKGDLERGRAEYPVADHGRPKTRGECASVPRPCPFVSCRWHLYADVLENGNLKLNMPDIEPGDMKHSCCLDIADRGRNRLEDVGEVMNTTRERIRQIEGAALVKLAASAAELRQELEP